MVMHMARAKDVRDPRQKPVNVAPLVRLVPKSKQKTKDAEMPHHFVYGDKGVCKYCGRPKEAAVHQAKTFKEYMTPLKDSAPFNRDTDVGCALIVLSQKNLSPEKIAKQEGFSLSFVKDVLSGKFGTTKKAIQRAMAKDVLPVPMNDVEKVDFAAYGSALRSLGYKKVYETKAGGERLVEYAKALPRGNRVEVQIFGSG